MSVIHLTPRRHVWMGWKVFCAQHLTAACHIYCHVPLTPAGQLHYSPSFVMLMACYLCEGQICRGQWAVDMHSIYASIIAFDDVDNYVALRRVLSSENYRKTLFISSSNSLFTTTLELKVFFFSWFQHATQHNQILKVIFVLAYIK